MIGGLIYWLPALAEKFFFDHNPSVRYRQHPNNLWGMNTSLRAQIIRVIELLSGRFKNWNNSHIAALNPLKGLLSPKNLEIFVHFSSARKKSLIPRLIGLKKSGVYRQSLINNLGFLLAAVLGKV